MTIAKALVALIVLTSVAAPQAASAQERTAKQIQRERQHLAQADRPAEARTGEARAAAAHEGKPRHRTAAEMQRARQHLPPPQD
jgi:uncharacterized low-complexity protein